MPRFAIGPAVLGKAVLGMLGLVAVTRAALASCDSDTGCLICTACTPPVQGDIVIGGGGSGLPGGGTTNCYCNNTVCRNSQGAECERCISCPTGQVGYFSCDEIYSLIDCTGVYYCWRCCSVDLPAWRQPLVGGNCGSLRHCYADC